MAVSRAALLALVAFAAIAGCRHEAEHGSGQSTPVADTGEACVPVFPPEQSIDEDGSVEEAATESVAAQEAATPQQETEPVADQSIAVTPSERLALLTPGGPVLVDVSLTVDGRPYREAYDGLVKRFLDAADTDGDGKATWKELVANQEFLRRELGDVPSGGAMAMRTLIEQYDKNKDGQVQASELSMWLAGNSEKTADALTVRSSRAYLPLSALTSRVWKLLDTDGNGQLSKDETQQAPARFLALDADDDGTIVPAELASLRDQLSAQAGPQMGTNRQATRDAAMQLRPAVNASKWEALLTDLYSSRQPLRPTSFTELPKLFDQLDANHNVQISQEELKSLATIEPQLTLSVDYLSPTASDTRPTMLKLQSHAPEVSVIAEPSADRVVVAFGKTRLIISANDSGPRSDVGYGAYRSQLHAMVHDQCDALFEELDANADGRIGEREIATSPQRLLERDANGDGQLSSDELPNAMIVAFLRGERPGEQSFFTPSSTATARRDVPAPTWFQHADFNGDGDISRREFVGRVDQFNDLDANRDGFISGDEAAALSSSENTAAATQ